MSDGIMICHICRATLIVEEANKHKHTETWKIIGDTLYVRRYDGKWHSHDLPPENHGKFNTGTRHGKIKQKITLSSTIVLY